MPTTPVSLISPEVVSRLAPTVTEGLCSRPKWLPAWLFYDDAGSQLFEKITELPEYYLTRTEHAILKSHAEEIIARAAGDDALRLVELGAGSASKTSLLLQTAVDRQDTVIYEPIDVSAGALAAAQERLEREIPGVLVAAQTADYTRDFSLAAPFYGEKRLVLYIGSSIGNFEPHDAEKILKTVRAALRTGDSILLGVDLVKDEHILRAAYDDGAGVTAAFNRNILARLNRELGARFQLDAFAHRAAWNAGRSRMEMHLESLSAQRVEIPSLDLNLRFEKGETIHTENSYKYQPGQPERLLAAAGFESVQTWNDERAWFAVCLARVV